MRLLSAWRNLLAGDEDGTGPDNWRRSHWRAGVLAGLACGTVAVHALASKRLETAEEPEKDGPEQKRITRSLDS